MRKPSVKDAKRLAATKDLRQKRRIQKGGKSSKEIARDLRLEARAIVSGWDTDFVVRQRSMREARKLLKHTDAEVKLSAIKVIQAADTIRMKAMEMMDKADRLDSGKPTENVRFTPLSFGAES